MKYHPLIFTGASVLGMLDDRITMTRRVLRPSNATVLGYNATKKIWAQLNWDRPRQDSPTVLSLPYIPEEKYGVMFRVRPRYEKGDRIWVKEMWAPHDDKTVKEKDQAMVYYRADDPNEYPTDGKWKSPMFMPHWASRIILDVKETRIERVQEITSEDIIAEGIGDPIGTELAYGTVTTEWNRRSYIIVWNSIHGPGAWERNDWVVVTGFGRLAT